MMSVDDRLELIEVLFHAKAALKQIHHGVKNEQFRISSHCSFDEDGYYGPCNCGAERWIEQRELIERMLRWMLK